MANVKNHVGFLRFTDVTFEVRSYRNLLKAQLTKISQPLKARKTYSEHL